MDESYQWLKGKFYNVDGKAVEMFSIGQFGEKIGRYPETIRRWERRGILPPARYRMYNRRLYSLEQLEVAQKIVQQEKMSQGKRITDRIAIRFWESCKNLWVNSTQGFAKNA